MTGPGGDDSAPARVRPRDNRRLAHLTLGDGVTLCGLRAVGWVPADDGRRTCAACAKAGERMGRVGERLGKREEAGDGT